MRLESSKTASDDMMLTQTQAGALDAVATHKAIILRNAAEMHEWLCAKRGVPDV
jgi:hypothetical protein